MDYDTRVFLSNLVGGIMLLFVVFCIGGILGEGCAGAEDAWSDGCEAGGGVMVKKGDERLCLPAEVIPTEAEKD